MGSAIDQFNFHSVRASEAKKELSELIENVHHTQMPVEIRTRGKSVYLISEDDMEELADMRLAFNEIDEEEFGEVLSHMMDQVSQLPDFPQNIESKGGKVIAIEDFSHDD